MTCVTAPEFNIALVATDPIRTAVSRGHKGDDGLRSSWFTGTVQLRRRCCGFKAPHDAVKLGDGSILVNELGSKSLVRASGEHGKDRTVVISGLEGPVGLAAGSGGTVYLTEAFAGQVSKVEANGEKNRDRQGSEGT